jgi:glycosyltransferase involved in cell wall biosynthesis
LHAAGHFIEAWTTLEDQRPRFEFRLGYRIRRFDPFARIADNPISFSLFRHAIATSDKFDLIVAHSHLVFSSCAAALKSICSRTPLVLVSHGFKVHRGRLFDTAENAYLSTVSRQLLQQCRHVVALTPLEAERMKSLGVQGNKCTVVPAGVDCDYFRPKVGVRRRGSMILWTGRFVEEKNLGFLVTVFAHLRSSHPELKLVLVGDGPERLAISSLVRSLELGDSVELPGTLQSPQILALLRQANVFCLPSTSEGLPLSVLESMATGVPVIASQGIGLEDIIGNGGLFARESDIEDWTSKLEFILKSRSSRGRLAQEARRLAVDRYDWGRVAAELEAAFRGAL